MKRLTISESTAIHGTLLLSLAAIDRIEASTIITERMIDELESRVAILEDDSRYSVEMEYRHCANQIKSMNRNGCDHLALRLCTGQQNFIPYANHMPVWQALFYQRMLAMGQAKVRAK